MLQEFRRMEDSIKMAPCHVYWSTKYLVKGAITNVPFPVPHTDMPRANARFLSK